MKIRDHRKDVENEGRAWSPGIVGVGGRGVAEAAGRLEATDVPMAQARSPSSQRGLRRRAGLRRRRVLPWRWHPRRGVPHTAGPGGQSPGRLKQRDVLRTPTGCPAAARQPAYLRRGGVDEARHLFACQLVLGCGARRQRMHAAVHVRVVLQIGGVEEAARDTRPKGVAGGTCSCLLMWAAARCCSVASLANHAARQPGNHGLLPDPSRSPHTVRAYQPLTTHFQHNLSRQAHKSMPSPGTPTAQSPGTPSPPCNMCPWPAAPPPASARWPHCPGTPAGGRRARSDLGWGSGSAWQRPEWQRRQWRQPMAQPPPAAGSGVARDDTHLRRPSCA